MFSSLSRCKPSSVVTTSFTAKNPLTLAIDSSIAIKVNNVLRPERPVSIGKNDAVSALLIAPSGWSSTRKISYSLNGDPLSFVIANENRSSINFTLQGLANRWYRYDVEDNHFVSYYDYTDKSRIRELGFNDVPFAVDIGSNIKDFGPNNFIVKNPTGLKKKRPLDAGSHYDEIVFENDYLTVDKNEEFSLNSDEFTIDIRVKPASIHTTEKYIVGTLTKNENGFADGWAITVKSGLIYFLMGDQLQVAAQDGLVLNEWNHVAVTRDSSSTKIWINGKLSSASSMGHSDNFVGSLKIATSEDKTLFPALGNKKYNFIGALSCLRIIKGDCIYKSNFEVPEPVLSLTQNTVLLTIQEDPGTIYLINVIPDPKTKTVYFYNQFGHLLDNIKLPSEPCQVEKFVSEDGGYFIVSCRNKRLYKITLDKRVINKDYLLSNDGKILEWIFQLPFETDVAFVGTFSTFAKIKNKQINIGQPNSISMSNGKTWVGGYNKIWQIDKYFNILQDFDVAGTIVGLTSLGEKCVAIIKNETSGNLDLTVFDSSGISGSIHNSKWMSEPLLHNGSVYVSDSTRRALVKIDTDTMTKQLIDLGNNTPSYLSSNSSSIFIACHDNNRVLIYSGPGQEIEEVYFPEKVTWVSALENSFMVSHYLKDVQVLAHDNPSIIYDKTQPITCEKSMAAIRPFKIKNLGISSYAISAVNGITHWFDGVPNATVKHGGYFTLSKALDRVGYHQENIIIGDTVVDYMAHVAEGKFYPKNFSIDPISTTSVEDLVEISFQYKHDFISQFNEAYRSSAYASVNYGFLKKNFMPYFGTTKILDGDIVTVCVPFGISIPNTVVTLSIGSREFLVPINNSTVITEVKTFLDLERTSRLNHTFTVKTGGKYFIPYFENRVSPDLRIKDVFFNPNAGVFNLGGNFSEDYPMSNLGTGDEAFVPAENGLFDVYLDANYPIVASRLEILIESDYETLQVIDEQNPLDEDGNPNYIEVRKFRKTPVNFNVLASSNGVNWVLIESFNGVPNGPNDWIPGKFKVFSFENDMAYRYWRFENTSTQGLGVAAGALKLGAKFPSLFSIKRNGSAVNSGVITLSEGDSISIEISSNDRLYDAIRYFIVGPDNYELFIRNKSNETLSYTIFNEINEPLLRDEYVSESIEISSDATDPVILRSFDPLLLMSKNDDEFSQTVEVTGGDAIRLKKIIRNVFDSESSVYDKQQDLIAGEFVNVDVIKINVKNIVLTGPAYAAKKDLVFSKPTAAVNSPLFLRSIETRETKSNFFNPMKAIGGGYLMSALALSTAHSLERFDLVENFIDNISIAKLNTVPNSIQFNLSTKFNKIINTTNSLKITDILGFLKNETKYSSIESLGKESNSSNFWNIDEFEFNSILKNCLSSIGFDIQNDSTNYYVADRFGLELVRVNFNLILHLFSFLHARHNQIVAAGNEYIEDLKSYLNSFFAGVGVRLHNPLVFNRFGFNYTLVEEKLFSQFNYGGAVTNSLMASAFNFNGIHANDLILISAGYSTASIETIKIAGFNFDAYGSAYNLLSGFNFDAYGSAYNLLSGYSIIAPAPGNLLFSAEAAVVYQESLVKNIGVAAFPFKNSTFGVLLQNVTYNINQIKTYDILNFTDNLLPLPVNYLYVKIDYATHDRLLYTFKENGFYGFFDSVADAANEARRKNHTPFRVYGIPQTNKWTYRREYQFIDGCSIGDGRIKRLVQGG